MVEVICDDCKVSFSVEDRYVRVNKKGFVRITAQYVYCPHCNTRWNENDTLDLAGVGSVKFSGVNNMHIGGDVIGGNSIKINIKHG